MFVLDCYKNQKMCNKAVDNYLHALEVVPDYFNPFQDGYKKNSRSSFSPVTSTEVRISYQNFLTFSFNPFSRLVTHFRVINIISPKLLNLKQYHP